MAGKMKPLPFAEIINPATQRMNPRMVDVTSESYASARSYMFRLEPADLEESSQLAKIAAETNLAPEHFRTRFGYLAGVK